MMRLNTVILATCFALCAGLSIAAHADTEYVSPPPDRDWRQGPPPSYNANNGDVADDFSGDFFEPPPMDQQDLGNNAPPDAPMPGDDEQPRDQQGHPIPPPPPGYENMTMPGEPPRW